MRYMTKLFLFFLLGIGGIVAPVHGFGRETATEGPIIFSGSANFQLAKAVADHLKVSLI